MASKPSANSSAQYPHQLSASDALLASRLVLPKDPCIYYALFKPSTRCTPSAHESIEHARRSILSRNGSAGLLDSMLTSVHIGLDSFLYVFVFRNTQEVDASSSLNDLLFDGLCLAESSSFLPQHIYSDDTPDGVSLGSTLDGYQSCKFPDAKHRIIYSHFFEAIRVRLTDDIVHTSLKDSRRLVKRYKDGFLTSRPTLSTEWGANWEYKATARPLIFCYLHIQVCYGADELVIFNVHPIIRSTPFVDLLHSLPLASGTPITLLPYGTPAFYIANYTGPTTGLTKQFRDSLQGLGVGDWETPSFDSSASSSRSNAAFYSNFSLSGRSTAFIIGWIKVENKNGEDKGITIIYPARLCLSYISPHPIRPPLDYIPELPSQLQPSPQVPPAMPPSKSHINSLGVSHCSEKRLSSQIHFSCPPYFKPTRHLASPTSDSLRAFRALTLSKAKGVHQVATEVGGYVDAVAKEREKERERLKREREGGTSSSPKLMRAIATTPASAPAPASADTPSQPIPPAPPPLTQIVSDINYQPMNLPPIMQNFYPSPPQNSVVTPRTISTTAPLLEPVSLIKTDTPTSSARLPTSVPPTERTPVPVTASSYDPFGSMDTSWSQSSQSYLNLDMDLSFGMDMGMSFGMNLDSLDNGGGGGRTYDNPLAGIDFEDAITDEDFSFFDRPSQGNINAPSNATFMTNNPFDVSVSALTQPAAHVAYGSVVSPPSFGDLGHLDLQSAGHNSAVWSTSAFIEGFTPRSIDNHDVNSVPELYSSSPGQSPESHSLPATPNVHLEVQNNIRRPSLGHSMSSFEPIPFAPYHRVADGKYAMGKFALPSPPAEEDRTEPIYTPSIPTSPTNGWVLRYKAITDPRVGLVRKLIGVKRKAPFEQGGRESARGSPIKYVEDDWQKTDIIEDVQTDPESEEDDAEESESPLPSRPSTPPPAFLPLGPTLLHTYFRHDLLLPLSKPLRPPGAAVAPTNLAASVLSVPTPVSPAATLGAASEKSKSLEAAASAIAAEVVENSLWAETWRANTRSFTSCEIWPADLKLVTQLLKAVPTLEGPIDMASLFGLDKLEGIERPLQILESPMITVGKEDAVVQILPTALRFWDKLGLSPKSGIKSAIAFVLFEDDGNQSRLQTQKWISGLISAYQNKHLGDLSLGSSSSSIKDGLIPLRYDPSFRKTLASFTANLLPTENNIVFFLVLPVITMTLASPVLRQVLSAVKKAYKAFPMGQIVFQFVPEQYVRGPIEQSPLGDSHIENLCFSVYNRILTPVERLMARQFPSTSKPIKSYFQEPAFTLARPLHHKVSYSQIPHTSLDVVDRQTLLHVGYHTSPCGKWIVAACIDQRGDGYDLGVWLSQTPGEDAEEVSAEVYVVRKVWDFTIQFTKKADVEWTLVITKLGAMSEQELQAWNQLFLDALLYNKELTAGHIALLAAEPDAPFSLIATSTPPLSQGPSHGRSPSSVKHQAQTIFTDVSSTTHVIFPSVRLPVFVPPSETKFELLPTFIPDPSPLVSSIHDNINSETPTQASPTSTVMSETCEDPSCPLPHPLSYFACSAATLIRVPCSPSPTSISMLHTYILRVLHLSQTTSPLPDLQDLHATIIRNFHELAILAKTRWKMDANPILPFHLAALEVIHIALDRDWNHFDAASDC